MMTMLKFHRITKGIKANELADKCGVSKSMISKIENGICLGSKKTRNKISDALNVSPTVLFGFNSKSHRVV